MQKIALFGGSGRTGQQFLNQALAQEYTIKALVRTPEKITQQSTQLEVIKGDVLDAAAVAQVVAGTDVVVSLFGQVKGSPAWVQTEGTQNIISAMQKHDIKRIISLSGGGLPYKEKDRPKLPDHLIRFIMRLAVPQILNDAQKHYEALQASGLDWTIVRAPRLTDGERRGQYRIGWVGVNASTQISRADLADFIIKQLNDKTFYNQLPFVSY
ncbi:MAG TPA: SDR family oxidoreductase [Saprospiraceae bacterium]|nr:SDR family oxidoreductase [Saprospiraceae bacterium]HMP24035.1 SDR family oxidoreductase [Saprospiraceae bacterium]